ncbi:hypothetical protein [Rubellimicrobium arenae]|uniref:hypothetical protein n=1 Tax=Rubellimicrobium arenae TaxID=2817372 RepID=UPI001B3160B3|nr:hypothetical protein [Rubellimicrobium arenae]
MLEWFKDSTTFQNTMNGVLAAATALGVIFGLTRKGAPKEADAPRSLEVVGEIINHKEASAVIAALDMNTMALMDKKRALERNADALNELSDQMLKLGRDVRDLRESIRDNDQG